MNMIFFYGRCFIRQLHGIHSQRSFSDEYRKISRSIKISFRRKCESHYAIKLIGFSENQSTHGSSDFIHFMNFEIEWNGLN